MFSWARPKLRQMDLAWRFRADRIFFGLEVAAFRSGNQRVEPTDPLMRVG